jgi:ATP-dependent RNA helicase RhlE
LNARTHAKPDPEASFDALGLLPELLNTVRTAGYAVPTPIQWIAIPHVLAQRDLLGCAQTGTGKTAAFALPILDRLLRGGLPKGKRPIRALVLAPTRELAAQIAASFVQYTPRGTVRCDVIFGGVGKQRQVAALRRGLDVLVATPGRLLDLLDDGEVDLAAVETFVLDEADRMLDMGFIHDVRRIAGELPRSRQTLLFSATMPTEIRELAERVLWDPMHVAVDPIASTVEPIAQSVYFVDQPRKVSLLLELLKDPELDRALVFTRTKHGAKRVAQKLQAAGIGTAAIHGNKSQAARESALARFKRGDMRVVVATDIASRGIDVKSLSHVINFDLPNEPEVYVHRVGRTGRAGESGTALSLCAQEERGHLAAIERLTRRRLERLELPEGLTGDSARQPQRARSTSQRVERRSTRRPGSKPKARSARSRV